MERRGLSLADVQDVPSGNLILLSGPPGAGKSTFCHQAVLNGLAIDKPVIYVTTEHGPSEVTGLLKERGGGEPPPGALSFIDAFGETVGATATERPDTVSANCEDLNSISMAITKIQQRIGRRDIFLAFDSLTSPYLFNREEVFRFIRLCLAKFASEGNSVLALMDEGCGREEDLGAMMSVGDGILRMEVKERFRTLNVVKHPKVAPSKIETPMTWNLSIPRGKFDLKVARSMAEGFIGAQAGQPVRAEVGDLINAYWRNLASWSGMLWDPKRFPTMAYESDKEAEVGTGVPIMKEAISHLPLYKKLLFKSLMPKSFSEVKDVKRFLSLFFKSMPERGYWIWEYMAEASRKDEHYIRLYENSSCWGFDNVGSRLSFHDCGELSGALKGMEEQGRDWNVVETKCIGLGDPYCEFRAVPKEIDELKDFLEGIDSSVVEKVHHQLMEYLTGFLVHGKPLPERPKLGSGVYFHEMHHTTVIPAHFSERYRMALRMGGARSGKEVGERLINAGISEDEVIRRVIAFMNYCKVGKVTLGETIRLRENCESYGFETGQPSCFFTTGFLNGLFSAVKNQHVREIKCIAVGDPYCEWEII